MNKFINDYYVYKFKDIGEEIEKLVKDSADGPVFIGIDGIYGSQKSDFSEMIENQLKENFNIESTQIVVDGYYYTRKDSDEIFRGKKDKKPFKLDTQKHVKQVLKSKQEQTGKEF